MRTVVEDPDEQPENAGETFTRTRGRQYELDGDPDGLAAPNCRRCCHCSCSEPVTITVTVNGSACSADELARIARAEVLRYRRQNPGV